MTQQWEYCELKWQVSARYEMTRPEVHYYVKRPLGSKA
jgi:hypothetical protein